MMSFSSSLPLLFLNCPIFDTLVLPLHTYSFFVLKFENKISDNLAYPFPYIFKLWWICLYFSITIVYLLFLCSKLMFENKICDNLAHPFLIFLNYGGFVYTLVFTIVYLLFFFLN